MSVKFIYCLLSHTNPFKYTVSFPSESTADNLTIGLGPPVQRITRNSAGITTRDTVFSNYTHKNPNLGVHRLLRIPRLLLLLHALILDFQTDGIHESTVVPTHDGPLCPDGPEFHTKRFS